ncbi:hypothetical protein [Luteimonas kalidii]|uniref:DUF5666 domain-containing protein n=1 Tax=Luteimonas kalidii TaxID=3042025 RepID=A0ABT6JS15_9GAMM|nr:hypothetical protein [Luteimonas kalidii]MDH5833479.1 hypothetical protein [Luteimonas kalidii]
MFQANLRVLSAFCLLLGATACTTMSEPQANADGERSIEGTIVSIDTQPWTYDGNAVVVVDAGTQGQVQVQLPARWNLCAAAPVDVEALSVGMRVAATGTAGEADTLVVCQQPSHRLAPAP